MGGENESVLTKDKKATPQGSVLAADRATPLGLQEEKKKKKKKKREAESLIAVASEAYQQQNIRQHVSGGEVHFHVDDEGLKTAVPTAEWWNAVRQLGKAQPFTWVDAKNKTTAKFTPIFKDGVLDVVVKIESLKIGSRMEQLLGLAK